MQALAPSPGSAWGTDGITEVETQFYISKKVQRQWEKTALQKTQKLYLLLEKFI